MPQKPQAPVAPQQPTRPVPQTGGPAIGVNNGDLTSLQAQRRRTIDEIHKRGGAAKATGYASRLNTLNEQIRGLRNGASQPSAPTPEAAPAPDQTGEVSIPQNPGNPPASDDASSALFPSLKYQLPENYEGSPMYKWQMEQGNKMLNRRLAANGLMNSGAEIEAANQLQAQVGAQESDRLRGDMQTEADRYERISANEATRRTNAGDAQWRRLMDLADFSTRNSPMDMAYQGLGGYQDLFGAQSKERSGNRANNFTRVSAGGGGNIAPFMPPPPSGPNYTNADIARIMMQDSNRRNTGSFFDSLIGGAGQLAKLFG
jgi:hypothetical protein